MVRERARTAGVLLGHGVTTFPQLTEALARDYRVAPHVLPPELAAVVLESALLEPGVPAEFRGARRGMLRELLDAIGELQGAYLSPRDVATIAGRLPPGAGAQRLAALGRVYGLYEARLAGIGAVDRHGREWRVCERLLAARERPPSLAGVRRLVLAEIYSFSILQFLTATSLIRLVGDAELVTLAHPENVDASRFLERTWNRFVSAADIADQVLPDFVVRGGRQGDLDAVLRGVFASDRPPLAPRDGSVRLRVAPNRYREVEAAGRDIRTRLETGTSPDRLAFLARDLGVYADLIEDVCRRYGIPVHFRKGRPLLGAGVAKLVLNLLRCVVDGFPRRRLEALLDSDYLRIDARPLLRSLRRCGFVGERVRPLAECLAHTAAPPGDRARLEAVVATLRSLDAPRRVRDQVRALRRVLRALRFRPVPGMDAPAAVARRDARAWHALDDTLTALAALGRALGLPPLPLGDFVRLLVAALEPQELADHGYAGGSVHALSVLDARGLDFDAVWLLGLDDGTFPAPQRESPLLPDALKRDVNPIAAAVLREKLGAHAEGVPLGGLLRTAREASLEDPFLFFLAVSMPERELVLSYPAADERGNPTVPSPFVDEVGACLVGGLQPERESATALVPVATDCRETAELVARAVLDRWAPAPDAAPDRLAAALADVLPDGRRRLAAIDRRARIEDRRGRYFLAVDPDTKGGLADAFVGRLAGPPGSLPDRLRALAWSPTTLERLAACGFRFFGAKVLGLREPRDPDVDVAAHEQGTLFHAAIRDFFTRHPALPADLAAARALVPRFLAEARASIERAIAPKHPRVFALTWHRLAVALDQLVTKEHEAQQVLVRDGVRVTRRLEERLAWTMPDPAGGSPVGLTGQPDRVELHEKEGRLVAVRVVDYKTARNTNGFAARLDPKRDLGRTSFQIPVYLLGTLAGPLPAPADDAALLGGYVFPLIPEVAHAVKAIDPALLDASAIPQRIRDLVASASAGRFDVAPDPCDPWCAFRPVCRYQPPPPEDDAPDAADA